MGNHATRLLSCLKSGTYAPGATPGSGSGSASTARPLVGSVTFDEDGGHDVFSEMGGQTGVAYGLVKRTLRWSERVSDFTFPTYVKRATLVTNFPQCLTFLVGTDAGFAATLTDAYLKSAKFALGGPTEFLMADYEAWALRKAAGTYAAQGAASGYGPLQGVHLTTFTIDASANLKLQSFETTIDNQLGWHRSSDPQTSGDELEAEEFSLGTEVVTATFTFFKETTGHNVDELTLNLDEDIVATFTNGGHTLTFTWTDMMPPNISRAIPSGEDGKYVQTVTMKGKVGAGFGALAITST